LIYLFIRAPFIGAGVCADERPGLSQRDAPLADHRTFQGHTNVERRLKPMVMFER
jgi:hypothetical protein